MFLFAFELILLLRLGARTLKTKLKLRKYFQFRLRLFCFLPAGRSEGEKSSAIGSSSGRGRGVNANKSVTKHNKLLFLLLFSLLHPFNEHNDDVMMSQKSRMATALYSSNTNNKQYTKIQQKQLASMSSVFIAIVIVGLLFGKPFGLYTPPARTCSLPCN